MRKLTLSHVLTLWAEYYVFIMGKPLEVANLVSQTTIYNNIYCLHLIDHVMESEDFALWIK